MRRIAEALGISVRTVAKWVARSRQTSELGDGSSRPHRQPRRLAATLEAAIVALRRTRATAWQISAALRIPRSTVTRVLARARAQSRRAPRAAAAGPALRVAARRRPVARRPEAARPRRRHWASHPWRSPASRARRSAGSICMSPSMTRRGSPMRRSSPAADAPACAAFLQQHAGVVSSSRRSRPPPAHRQRDGLSRAASLPRVCRRWAVRHRFTRPYRPQTNGKAERFIQTLLREWAYRVPVSQLGSAHRRAQPVSPFLQPPASTHEPRSALAVDAFPRGCLR